MHIFRVAQPLCLGKLITYFDPGSQMPVGIAYLYATGVVLCSLMYTLCVQPNLFELGHVGMQVRVATCSLLYKKVPNLSFKLLMIILKLLFQILLTQCLALSQNGLGQTTIGQLTNLMSNDVSRFDTAVVYFPFLLVGPLQALIITVILLFIIGPSCLAGFGFLFLLMPLQSNKSARLNIKQIITSIFCF